MKSFQIEKKADKDPVEFELVIAPVEVVAPEKTNGKTKVTPIKLEPRIEVFHVIGVMPAWLMIEVEASQGMTAAIQAQQYLRFFDTAIVEEDRARWREVVRDPANQITSSDLAPIFNWLYEVYAGRPTKSV